MSLKNYIALSVRLADTEALKIQAQMIHYFGLGFIQIKFNELERVHVYTKRLPAIVSEEAVHNHRYNFRSEVMAGSLVQTIYEAVPGEGYLLVDESCREGVKSETEPEEVNIEQRLSCVHRKGDYYEIGASTFHRVSSSEGAITYLKREPPHKEFAQVINKIGEPEVCPFSKKIEEKQLWAEVARNLEGFLWT